MWRKLLVLTLVTSLVHVSGVSTALMAKSLLGPEAIQQKVEWAGVGSYITLKLRDGKKLKGRLEAIEEKFFTVMLLQILLVLLILLIIQIVTSPIQIFF